MKSAVTGPGGALLTCDLGGGLKLRTGRSRLPPPPTSQPTCSAEFTFDVRAREDFGPWSERTVTRLRVEWPVPLQQADMRPREVDEGAPAGSNVGKPVAVAAQGFDVTYSLLGGTDNRFMINGSTGQVTVNEGAVAPGTYFVAVHAKLSKEVSRASTFPP